MPEIFDFNNIDPKLDDEKKEEIKNYYKYYHKVWWCYKKTLNRFNRINIAVNVATVSLIAAGTIAGGITANPFIIGILPAVGVGLKVYSETKKLKHKISVLENGVATYEKVLTDLRSYMRGQNFIHDNFIFKMNFIDSEIIDLMSLPLSIRKKSKKNSANLSF